MLNRRRLLLTSLFGSGYLGLRSLLSGLPISFLMRPTRAAADPAPAAQFLVLATSGTGDPINANSPGTYDLPSSYPNQPLHPPLASMAPTPITLGGKSYNAALPWSTLTALDRTQFFHHSTRTNNHSDQEKVMSLMGAIMTVGISVSNSILVVSFARERLHELGNATAAALEAGMVRFRPVLMTALAMIIGMLPMAMSLGEGGEQNAPLGRAVIGGLLVATFATLMIVPVIFSLAHRKTQTSPARGGLELEQVHV
jgi:hypothetical protein